MNVNGMHHTRRLKVRFIFGTNNTLGRALIAAMDDNQIKQCKYFE